jgi:hypothetical protein
VVPDETPHRVAVSWIRRLLTRLRAPFNH